MPAQTQQSPDQKGHLGTRNSAVSVGFINHDEGETPEEGTPLVVPWQYLVQFMRIGQDNACRSSDTRSLICRGISIIKGW